MPTNKNIREKCEKQHFIVQAHSILDCFVLSINFDASTEKMSFNCELIQLKAATPQYFMHLSIIQSSIVSVILCLQIGKNKHFEHTHTQNCTHNQKHLLVFLHANYFLYTIIIDCFTFAVRSIFD